MKLLARLALGITALAVCSFGDTITFTLDPLDGAVFGASGSAVGWGYTISVTGSDYIQIQSFSFADLTPIGIFSTPGVPLTAAYAGSPIQLPFSAGLSGLQYDISFAAGLGFSTSGVMTLTYDTFSDPGLTNQIGFGDTVNATNLGSDVVAQVTVDSIGVAVPEPATFGLFAIGAGIFALARRAHRSSRT